MFSGWKTRWTWLSHTLCCARRMNNRDAGVQAIALAMNLFMVWWTRPSRTHCCAKHISRHKELVQITLHGGPDSFQQKMRSSNSAVAPMPRCFPVDLWGMVLGSSEIMLKSFLRLAMESGNKKNRCSPSQTLTAHWQPLWFREVHSSTIVFGGLKKRTVGRRRKRSVLICNLCGFTKSTHLPLSLEVCMSNMVAAPNNQAPMVFLSREKVSLFFLSARPLVRFPSC